MSAQSQSVHRILLVDDNRDIHADFRKVLGGAAQITESFRSLEAALFEDRSSSKQESGACEYELDSAYQGQEALHALQRAKAEGRPYSMAFVDVRMPPGWDGIETISRLWKEDPDLQCVVCTAFSDYSWSEMISVLGRTDQLLILKKPFEPIEVCQLANALTRKWSSVQRERSHLQLAKRAEQETRSYAVSLATLNRALSAAAASAQASSRAKTGILVNMAREVLAPMSVVLGDNQALALDREGLERMLRICGERGELGRLVEDMRDLADLEASEIELQSLTFSPRELIETCAAAHLADARAKHLTLECHVHDSVPEQVRADPQRLRRALQHLLRNAVDHTVQGGVRVEASARVGATWKEVMLSIRVRDSGCGLSHEKLTRVFEPFASLGEGKRRGIGLGLCITRRVAQCMGGGLEVESQPNVGSSFSLNVPCAIASAMGESIE